MNAFFLLCKINSPSINELKHLASLVIAPVNITFIFILIKYILPALFTYNKCLIPSALSVTQYANGSVIFGTITDELIGPIFCISSVTKLGPIKSLGYIRSFGM